MLSGGYVACLPRRLALPPHGGFPHGTSFPRRRVSPPFPPRQYPDAGRPRPRRPAPSPRRASEAGHTVEDTSVILLWLPGGPPHMETYDMKPDAPAEYRGDFKPIPTNVPGMEVCEHLPRHARIADKYTLIRSISHNFADHGGGHKRFLTGRDPKEPTGIVNDYPMVGSMTAKMREGRNVGLPNYVSGVDQGRSDVDVFTFGAAYLGPSYHAVHRGRRPQRPEIRGQEPGHERGPGRPARRPRTAAARFRRPAPRGRPQRRHGRDGRVQPQGAPADDQREGAHRLRPVARAGRPARPLRPAPVGPAGAAGAAAGRGRQQLGDDGAGKPDAARRHDADLLLLQLGLARGQLPPLRGRQVPPADLRPGGDGAGRGLVRPRTGQKSAADRDGRVRPDAAHQLLGRARKRR